MKLDNFDSIGSDASLISHDSENVLKDIELDLIDDNPDNIRKSFNQQELYEMAESIKSNGLLSPVKLYKAGARYELEFGHRRVRACRILGLQTIKAIVLNNPDKKDVALANAIENIQFSPLSSLELAVGYRKIIDSYDLTLEEFGVLIGKSKTHISKMLTLLSSLSQKIQDEIVGDSIDVEKFVMLSKLPEDMQLEVFEKNPTRDEVKQIVKEHKQVDYVDLPTFKRKDNSMVIRGFDESVFDEIEKMLQDILDKKSVTVSIEKVEE